MGDLASAAEEVLEFWIGPLDESGRASEERSKLWWSSSDELDQSIRERFADLRGRAMAGALAGWASTARGRLALVIVLDQFSRNMFRGTADMFAADFEGARLTREGIDLGHDLELDGDERKFLYMPLMHSERMSEQHMGMGAFARHAELAHPEYRPVAEQTLDFGRRHFVIVERFGRYPHRNEILGRESSPEELAFLQEPGSSF